MINISNLSIVRRYTVKKGAERFMAKFHEPKKNKREYPYISYWGNLNLKKSMYHPARRLRGKPKAVASLILFEKNEPNCFSGMRSRIHEFHEHMTAEENAPCKMSTPTKTINPHFGEKKKGMNEVINNASLCKIP